LTADTILIGDGTGAAAKGALSGEGDTWLLNLDRVSAEGTISVRAGHFGDYYILTDALDVDVFKANTFGLTVSATVGGATSGDGTGQYFEGTPISVMEAPAPAFRFTGWTVSGVDVDPSLETLTFLMPDNPVTLLANFTADAAVGTPPPPPPAPGGTTPYEPPTATDPGHTVIRDGDGHVEIGIGGSPAGRWDWDEDEYSWIYTETPPPAGNLPRTGEACPINRSFPSLLAVLAAAGIGIAVPTRPSFRYRAQGSPRLWRLSPGRRQSRVRR
jgi:hypothetical protein